MKAAYADPPYIGQARKHYNCEEIDHHKLLLDLHQYDAWALSCSSPTLKEILSMPECPNSVRIASWVKPWCSFKPGVNPSYTWEPIIFVPSGRLVINRQTTKDHLIESCTMKKGLVGAKSINFCFWIFDLLCLSPDDDFIDIFPGTGIVGKCWESFCERESNIPIQLKLDG